MNRNKFKKKKALESIKNKYLILYRNQFKNVS